jgi:hypothetical protein
MAAHRILIVEDEKDIADLIRFNVEQAGFQSLILSEGRHLLTQVRRFRPDIILLDLMLSDVNGLDLSEKGDVGSGAFSLQTYPLISGISSEAANRFTHEVVTPRNLATSAPE